MATHCNLLKPLQPIATMSTMATYCNHDNLLQPWNLSQPWQLTSQRSAENLQRGQLSKCPGMWLFLCNHVWFMKSGAKKTTPVVWTEIQFKVWHWVSTLQATTPRPGPLFFSKQDRRISFMIPNHPRVWKVYLKVDYPPFWHLFADFL